MNIQPLSIGAGWTDQRVKILKQMWGAGASASQIARTLGGGATRNSVTSKVHRLGLPERLCASDPVTASTVAPLRAPEVREPSAHQTKNPLGSRSQMSLAQLRAAEVSAIALSTTAAAVMSLQDDRCKWPIGNPSDPAFSFCCEPVTRAPYCDSCRGGRGDASRAPYVAMPKKAAKELQRGLRRYL